MGELIVLFRGRRVHPEWPAELERAQQRTTVRIGGREVPRIRYGKEGRGWASARIPCHDCAAIRGEFHGPGCDGERCPQCGGQLFVCGCADEPAGGTPVGPPSAT